MKHQPTCYHCATKVKHFWHDNGTVNELDAWIWRWGKMSPPVFYNEKDGYQ